MARAREVLLAVLLGRPVPIGARIEVLEGPDAGATLPLGGDDVLGRGPEATLRLSDPSLSRRHARLRKRNGTVLVEDLRSKNGVELGGRALRRGRRLLLPGQRLRAGATVMTLRDDARPEGPVASPRPASARRTAGASALAAAGVLLGACAASLALASVLG